MDEEDRLKVEGAGGEVLAEHLVSDSDRLDRPRAIEGGPASPRRSTDDPGGRQSGVAFWTTVTLGGGV